MTKLTNANKNFKSVLNSSNPKFQKLDYWLEKESNLYLTEINNKKKRYIKLKRGTIVKVDFGVNPGSELCHTHFAIVISKYDNYSKESIIVLPLTSKPGVGRLPLNNLIKDEIIKKIKEKYTQNPQDIQDLTNIINEYKKYKNFSYAFISQITTISKSRLIYSNNKFDILNKARCSDEILNKIDSEILATITGIDLTIVSPKEKVTVNS